MKMKIHVEIKRVRIDKTKEPMTHSTDYSIDLTGELRRSLIAALDHKSKETEVRFFLS